jgi:hypothetical protein
MARRKKRQQPERAAVSRGGRLTPNHLAEILRRHGVPGSRIEETIRRRRAVPGLRGKE